MRDRVYAFCSSRSSYMAGFVMQTVCGSPFTRSRPCARPTMASICASGKTRFTHLRHANRASHSRKVMWLSSKPAPTHAACILDLRVGGLHSRLVSRPLPDHTMKIASWLRCEPCLTLGNDSLISLPADQPSISTQLADTSLAH